MEIKKGLYYTEENEWVRVEGNKAYIGITDYAQDALGDIVYIELPDVGDTLKAGDAFSVVESVKAASDVFLPVSGTVIEINEELEDSPELINEDPYGSWIIAVDLLDVTELDELMDAEAYEEFSSQEN
ncbi:MAG: glycine cleavage system protein GcvH [Clostridiales bacterium]|jgi:glycine cleavage system H protein|nr:glycine cleavage system protein GcvH [Clostridiales bacterium]